MHGHFYFINFRLFLFLSKNGLLFVCFLSELHILNFQRLMQQQSAVWVSVITEAWMELFINIFEPIKKKNNSMLHLITSKKMSHLASGSVDPHHVCCCSPGGETPHTEIILVALIRVGQDMYCLQHCHLSDFTQIGRIDRV